MKTIASLFLVSLLSAQYVVAHDDHHHQGPVTEQAAVSIGRDAAIELSKKDAGLGFGQLPASWAGLPVKNAKLHKSGEGYYIVAVTNDVEKKVLYVLLSLEGSVWDANFSGQFKGIKQ